MNKVLVIGCSGSGKSTLAIDLSQMLDLPLIHLDKLYWSNNWTEKDKEEWRQLQLDLVQEEKWIIDGNYGSTMDIRLRPADTVIFLDMPRYVCLFGVIKRYWMYKNKSRPDMNESCQEKLDLPFLKWIWSYNYHSRPGILKKLEDLNHKNIVVLNSRKELALFVSKINSQDLDVRTRVFDQANG